MSLRSFFLKIFRGGAASEDSGAVGPTLLDYEKCVHLDAEDLAEQGIRSAYQKLLPELRKYVIQPIEVEELFDPDLPSYAVRAKTFECVIYSPAIGGGEAESWGRATYAFFHCVNAQLAETEVRLYAINGGNDLSGLFLAPAQAESARKSLPRKLDWPYLPNADGPWHGQFH